MARVNLPPYVKIPKRLRELLGDDKESLRYFEDRDFIQFQLYKRSGGQTDLLADVNNVFITYNQVQLNVINARLGSGDPLTSDETGFTVDSSNLSVDMIEA